MAKSITSISICIPIYNQDIKPLVSTLANQASLMAGFVNIIAVDDASEEVYKNKNRLLEEKYQIHYEELSNNIGRSAIRNYMASISTGSHCLFLDGDSIIENPDFLKTYLDALEKNEDAVYCGGTYFQKANYDANKMLHWTYGTKVIAKLHSTRQADGRFHFMSSNFVIKKDVFKFISFDENIREYGHEDTIMGYELKEHQIDVIGIDNPVLHGSLDTNEVFLEKVSQSVFNLKKLKLSGHYEKPLQEIRLIRTAAKLSLSGFAGIYRWFFDAINALVFKNLNGDKPSLRLLSMYKLYLYSKKVVTVS